MPNCKPTHQFETSTLFNHHARANNEASGDTEVSVELGARMADMCCWPVFQLTDAGQVFRYRGFRTSWRKSIGSRCAAHVQACPCRPENPINVRIRTTNAAKLFVRWIRAKDILPWRYVQLVLTIKNLCCPVTLQLGRMRAAHFKRRPHQSLLRSARIMPLIDCNAFLNHQPWQVVEDVFREVDTTGNGKISYQQFSRLFE